MAEGPKKRRSEIISRTAPAIPRGPDSVSYDKPGVKFQEPTPEPIRDQVEAVKPLSRLERAVREVAKKELLDKEAQAIKDEIAAEEAMNNRRL